MHKETQVVDSNIFFLQQGIDLLHSITDEQYARNNGHYNKSGIGRHFRHIIEHYQSFIKASDNRIDYDARERNRKLETERLSMISAMNEIRGQIAELRTDPDELEKPVFIRSNEGIEEEGAPLSSSSIRRELQFLISHTVHHYALIGLILKTMGVDLHPDLGVAPSTLKFEKDRQSRTPAS